MKKIFMVAVPSLLGMAILVFAILNFNNNKEVDYREILEEPAYWIDGEAMPFSSLGFYILYQERVVEEQAKIYHPESTRDYWNLHVNGYFVRERAKNAIMETAIHDELYYRMAVEEGLTLTSDEQIMLQNAVSDFWMDMLDEQKDNQIVGDDVIVETERKIAYAQKYMIYLSEESGEEIAQYAWDGYLYKQWLKEKDIKINEKLWEPITIGEVSISHDTTNYVNGYSKNEEEEKEDSKDE